MQLHMVPSSGARVARPIAFRRASPAPPGRIVQRHATSVAAEVNWEALAKELDPRSPLEIMDHALKTFGNDAGIAFSGAEDVAVIEYAHLTGRPYRVFSLDTGRLNPETYRLFDKVEKHYNIHIEYTFPDAQEVLNLVRTKGMFSFYEDGHGECCKIRKVSPLRKQLKGLKAWVTGQRKDQSPGTRMAVPVVQVDPAFEGLAGGPGSLIKYNPLSNVSSQEVWNFLRVMNIPVNEMHEHGFVSIGCEPCTKTVLPNQHEREGRWWWEDSTAKECGLHSGNIVAADGTRVERVAERDIWPEGSAVVKLDKEQIRALASGTRDSDYIIALYAPWCPYCQAMELSYEQLAVELAGSGVKVAKYQADIDRDFTAETFGLKSFPTITFLPQSSSKAIKYPSERRDPSTLKLWASSMHGKL